MGTQGVLGMKSAEEGHWPVGTTMHPAVAVQQAPCVLGQGLGLQVWPGKNCEPGGHWDWRTTAQLPAMPGMQHAPRGVLGHGLGVQGALTMNEPPRLAHSAAVVELQTKVLLVGFR